MNGQAPDADATAIAGAGGAPRYKVLAAQLRDLIHDHPYEVGDRLPTLSALARRFGVGRRVAQRGVELLVDEGLLAARRGSGIYVRRVPESRNAATVESLPEWHVEMPPVSHRPRLRLHLNDLGPAQTPGEEAGLRAAWEELVAGFNATHAAEIELLPYTPQLAETGGAGALEVCDLLQIHSGHFPRLVERDTFLPLELYAPDLPEALGAFPPWVVRDLCGDGAAWGVPTVGDLCALFTNLDLAEPLGYDAARLNDLTFDAYMETLRRLDPAAVPEGAALARSASGFLRFLITSGSLPPSHAGVLRRLPREACLAFLSAYAPVLRDRRALAFEPVHSLDGSGFLTGRHLFLDGAFHYRMRLREEAPFRWHVMPFPRAAGAPALCSCNYLCVSRRTSYPDVAARFLAYVARPESQRRLVAGQRLVFHPAAADALAAAQPTAADGARLREALQNGFFYGFGSEMEREIYAFAERQFQRWRTGNLEAEAFLDLIETHCRTMART
jgi:DNA-binding FadR family transcriptional regulator